jgi:hypothetical protein
MATENYNHVAQYITALSSTALRASAFIFLRWVSLISLEEIRNLGTYANAWPLDSWSCQYMTLRHPPAIMNVADTTTLAFPGTDLFSVRHIRTGLRLQPHAYCAL